MIEYGLLNKDTDSYDLVRHFLQKCDMSFQVPLSQRVDIDSYARKILDHSYIFLAKENCRTVGLASFYINDFLNRAAYLSLLCVDCNYYRRGIARSLVKLGLDKVREMQMSVVKVEVFKENIAAMNLYKSLGFTILANKTPLSVYMQYVCALTRSI